MRRFVDDGFVKKIILIFLVVLYILGRMYMGRAEETTLGLDHIYIYIDSICHLQCSNLNITHAHHNKLSKKSLNNFI